jgi:hypothetical protein
MSGTIQQNNPTSGASNVSHDQPKKGERYRCQQCGIEIEVTTPSQCGDPSNSPPGCCDSTNGTFQCFGHIMEKV